VSCKPCHEDAFDDLGVQVGYGSVVTESRHRDLRFASFSCFLRACIPQEICLLLMHNT